MTRIERHLTNDMPRLNLRIRNAIESSNATKWVFKVVGVFGVALLLAGGYIVANISVIWLTSLDGVLTPAQSILGAIQGYVFLELIQR
jgi:KUP system potassium uptake protein